MKKVASTVLISVIVLAVLIGLIVLIGALGLPHWPFIILLVCMAEVYSLSVEKYLKLAISGLVGILIGYSQVLLGFILPATAVTVVFLLIIIAFVALDVSKNAIIANIICMVNANILLNIPGVATEESFLPVLGGYAVGAVIVWLVCWLLKKAAENAAKKAASSKEA